MLEPRRVFKSNDPAISGFGILQEKTYFEPDMLIPGYVVGQMLEWNTNDRENALLVIEDAGEVVAGTVFHYFRTTNMGFSSYLAVDQRYRGQGLARRLHEARFATLDEIAGIQVHGVLIDVVNPNRLSKKELEAEHGVGSDPKERWRAFSSLGFQRIDVRYEQPVGGPNGGPITNMDLLFCSRETTTVVNASLVVETMRSMWQGWLRPSTANLAAQKLEAQAMNGQFGLLALEL
jgi:GNAT superfamily N-acetyltransferase